MLARTEQQPNRQTQEFDEKTEHLVQSREVLQKNVLADASPQEIDRYLDMFATARVEIFGLYARTVETYLRIGKVLCELKERSKESPQIYARFISDYDEHGQHRPGAMPFGKEVAYRLESVYTNVINGKFDRAFQVAGKVFKEEILPSYSVAYFFTTLSEDQLVEAVKQDLVRPDITQHQARFAVADIKRDYPEPSTAPKRIPRKNEDQRRLDRIHKDRQKLVETIKSANEAIARLDAEESEIRTRLGAGRRMTVLSIKPSSSPSPEAQPTGGQGARKDEAAEDAA